MEPFNLARKIFHTSSFGGIVLYYFNVLDRPEWQIFQYNTQSITFYALLLLFSAMVIVDLLRFRFESVQKFFIKTVGFMIKNHETLKHHGAIPYMLGLAFCVALLPQPFVVISALFLLSGDPAAAYFGGKYGKNRFSNGKSVEGLAAGIITAFIVGLAFLSLHTFLRPASEVVLWSGSGFHFEMVIILFLGAAAAYTAELFSRHGIFTDDNFVIPMVSGFMLSGGWLLYGYLSGHLSEAYVMNILQPDLKALLLPL